MDAWLLSFSLHIKIREKSKNLLILVVHSEIARYCETLTRNEESHDH